ncbi:hypothetical protein OV079_50350 [Nannocystis pusilla]|uniref:Uncharacterized protein n=1 Tax=Nannocystis pusilla TaxID=889268 RepID=A0A9X3J3C0_9BACT|nr:hypothetical protein [Nannocystis pusilla]MCY1013601.1 hypothetical protein [Nannocystis pusilla]
MNSMRALLSMVTWTETAMPAGISMSSPVRRTGTGGWLRSSKVTVW